uniref:NB-ARC domain-containing protein n=1 Tax=Setaria italica TaxID=4555 RepID=K3ZNR6_SETIT
MADLVLGLAKSAVEGTLTLANTAIEKEKLLQKSVKCDLMLISDEFEMMHSFLTAAREHIKNDMARTLVRQVRNMALDVEDCIESAVHLDKKSSWWRRLLPSCMPPAAQAAALDDAVHDIELLKARVEAMGERNRRYSHIGDSSSKPSGQMHQEAVTNATALDVLVVARDSMDESDRLDLLKSISKNFDELQLQVMSVWGSASNVGMASLIKEAYDKPEISKNFTRRAWVKLIHPFNSHEFIRSLLIQFYTNCCPQQGGTVGVLKPMEVIEARKNGLIKEFMEQLNNQRYLVVLEDMSTMDDWDTIRAYLPDNRKGSCIIVLTQQLEIASFCIGHSSCVSELKRFSDDHSVCVFLKEIDLSELHVAVHAANREVIFVWGIAGVGKSSIVRHVYFSEVLEHKCSNFERFGWVNVSHPINLRELTRSLLLDLHSESLQHCSMLRIKDPIQECRDLLHEHRCLIVIDDIQSVEEWDLIKAALALRATESSLKSRIIVITNEESVATSCATMNWNVRGLEFDEILDLFKKKVSEKTGSSDVSMEVIEQAKLILHKCGGFPRVIVSIAEFVSTQLKENRLNLEGWRMLNHNFMLELETNRAFGSLQGLFSWVHSYFLTCPDYLKPCIFYLSIFPINHNIQRMRLVRRWIAEGYCRDNKQSTALESAEEFFTKLVKLCMIRMLGSAILISSFGMPLCQANGFFHEYIISRSMEENLVFTLEGSCSMNSQRTGRHLAIGSTWDRDINVFKSIDFSRLRSLTVFGEWRSFFISDKMRLLRVLDLEDASGVMETDIDQMVKLLPRLKFLSLKGCSHISCLPDSLGDLQQLQTLDIRDTFIIMLPKSIIKLQKLQFIRAGATIQLDDDTGMNNILPQSAGSTSLTMPSTRRPHDTPVSWFTGSRNCCVKVPGGIGRLTALNSLGVIDVSVERGEGIMKELRNLTLLRDLGVSGINRNNSHKFFGAISGHRHLEFLSVKFDNDNLGCMDGIAKPPVNLRCLKFYGLVGKLPVWMMHLQSLARVNLHMTMLPQEELDAIENIPNLRILCLFLKEFQDGKLQFGRHFCQLHALEIACNSRLQSVTFDSGAMQNLEVLNIRCSSVSSTVFSHFSGLEQLRELKEVWLWGSYDVALKQHLQHQLDRHPKQIKPVLREEPRLS